MVEAKWLCGIFLYPETTSQGSLFEKVYCVLRMVAR
jgi:hypothetical protein